MSFDTCGIIGKSSALQEVFRILAKVAPSDSTVLVTGESGTGKELLVRALHRNSKRLGKPFVPINCGAIPRELLESELFGHEKGAFTHAIRTKIGRFELAHEGTVFLDEIGEMDLSLQVKILRVLQEREFERVGGAKTIKTDVRVVAATNRDLEEEVRKGTFREDLFYRLNVIPIALPPLRDRGQDVLILARYFLQHFCANRRQCVLELAEEASDILARYSWPGNVRELENIVERACILEETDRIHAESLPLELLALRPEAQADPSARSDTLMPLHAARAAAIEEFERRYLWALLQSCNGSIKKSADTAGITTRQLHKLMTRHHLDKKSFRPRTKRNS